MASITLVLFTTLKPKINSTNTRAMPKWARLRNCSLWLCAQMSTQKQVVRAVRAESALENEAATTPMVNSTTTVCPSTPVAAN